MADTCSAAARKAQRWAPGCSVRPTHHQLRLPEEGATGPAEARLPLQQLEGQAGG